MWSFWFVNSRTGAKVSKCQPSSHSWTRTLNGQGGGSATFQLADGSGLDYFALTDPWINMLVICWDNTPVFAGYTLTQKRDYAKNTLEVGLFDFRVMVNKRSTLGEDGYSREHNHAPIGSDAPGNGYSLPTIAAFEMRLLVEGPTGNFNLPVTLPSYNLAVHDGDQWRDYFDYEGPVLSKVLDDLMNTEGGPDIDYALSWSASTLVITPRLGVGARPHLYGANYEFNMTQPDNGLTDVVYTRDGTMMASDVTYMGKGSGVIRPFGVARRLWAGPALQRIQTDTAIETDEQAAAKARADLETFSTPTEQWEFKLLATGTPNAAELQSWPIFTLYFRNDGLVPDGFKNLRIVGFGGDGSPKLSTIVQPLEL